MAKSSALRLADLRAVHRLVGECRDLGDDAGTWRAYFARRAAELAGAGLAQSADGRFEAPVTVDHIRLWGLDNGFDPAALAELVRRITADPYFNPMSAPYRAALAAEDGTCLTRPELVADPGWFRSAFYALLREAGGGAVLLCYRAPGGARTGTAFSALNMIRPAGEPDFSARQKALVREVHAAVAPLLGGPLALFAEPGPAALPPLARRVLRCLLEGNTDKQVSARLGLTRHTVNQYAKVIFRHFVVESRAELLARWVARGWGGRFAWADG
ncbi:MAG: helix-turn-helix transcriptional regulator [Gemmataceae bacterium]|nr:helix-turn-helix transcriptional regulator [Gemmataceae bacterium]